MKKFIILILAIFAFGLIRPPQSGVAGMTVLTDEQLAKRYYRNMWNFAFRAYLETQKDIEAERDREIGVDDLWEDIEETKLNAHLDPIRLSSIPVTGKFRDIVHFHRRPDVYHLFDMWGGFLRVDLLTTDLDWFGDEEWHEMFTYIRVGSTVHSGQRFGRYGIMFQPEIYRQKLELYEQSMKINRELRIINDDRAVWSR